MELYHGSHRPFTILKRRQKTSSPIGSRKERRDAIYLSPSLAFSLFFASKPSSGVNMMDIRRKIIYFEKMSSWDPERDVYMHIVEISWIPKRKLKWNNIYELELRANSIKPIRIEVHKAKEVLEHFEVINDLEEFKRRQKTPLPQA